MRICARSGCNAPAIATLSYDRIALVAYLVTADDPTVREPGDLCERHVARLVLPRQWQLDDRRAQSAAVEPKERAPARAKKLRAVPGDSSAPAKPRPKRTRAPKPARASKWTEVGPSLFDAASEPATPVAVVDPGPLYMPRFGPDTDDDVLDAKTPLLRRAFGGR